MHFTVGNMHFAVGATDLVTPIPVYSDEVKGTGSNNDSAQPQGGTQKVWRERKTRSAQGMRQLHNMGTFIPRDPRTITPDERKKALSSLIFLKEKNTGKIKG
jgi:hypothetical protein